ncbi:MULTISPECIES: teicoplanin resistance protein VanZ [Veillonella]|jgi:vanZ family protein|uniref:Teicoplanin resistance protein VanZ n=1 Tax=Veillonella hominis TaxID=2764330 RepID=A0ABR7JV86_9FIRM|nr:MULTISPECIES: teicoplanin resistance protein VanZ [Veillonella]MBC6000761.1 teicoplanin resistance protein VanZ [Veillonella hominis]RJU18178.1 teicoplanin resistance protein VanZ [Veillonella sp. AF36-20BH]
MNDNDFEYIKYIEDNNILKNDSLNKLKYYIDIYNIEHSLSGRLDGNISNLFIKEAAQQLINAIKLFSDGYFDCAYYLLRSAIEISTIMVFLVDMPEDERKRYLDAWMETLDFPMQGKIIQELSRNGDIFVDMKDKMPVFFDNAKNLSSELNKYVHKQGIQHFYSYIPYNIYISDRAEELEVTFEKHLKQCIGIVSVMRLAIDPFPILLMDKEILYRCFDSITEPYTESFVEEYIGIDIIDCYKKTEIYTGLHDSFMQNEKKSESVFLVTNHEYIVSTMIKEILLQKHLLCKRELISVLLVSSNNKVVKVYCGNGLLQYYTDRNTKRVKLSWSSEDFKRFSNSKKLINQVYDEAYISVLKFDNELYFIEHNEKIEQTEIKAINDFIIKELKS